MRATRGIVAVGALALIATLVAGAGAVAARDSAPAFVLYSENGVVQEFDLKHAGDQATISVAMDELVDASGKSIGQHHWQCIRSSLTWFCTGVMALNDAAQKGAGTIIVGGLFEGFNGESLAVTGGTGAYAGARGTVVLSVDGNRLA